MQSMTAGQKQQFLALTNAQTTFHFASDTNETGVCHLRKRHTESSRTSTVEVVVVVGVLFRLQRQVPAGCYGAVAPPSLFAPLYGSWGRHLLQLAWESGQCLGKWASTCVHHRTIAEGQADWWALLGVEHQLRTCIQEPSAVPAHKGQKMSLEMEGTTTHVVMGGQGLDPKGQPTRKATRVR